MEVWIEILMERFELVVFEERKFAFWGEIFEQHFLFNSEYKGSGVPNHTYTYFNQNLL